MTKYTLSAHNDIFPNALRIGKNTIYVKPTETASHVSYKCRTTIPDMLTVPRIQLTEWTKNHLKQSQRYVCTNRVGKTNIRFWYLFKEVEFGCCNEHSSILNWLSYKIAELDIDIGDKKYSEKFFLGKNKIKFTKYK